MKQTSGQRHYKGKKAKTSSVLFGAVALFALIMLGLCGSAMAEDWSDTSIGFRYGTEFAEPFVTGDIAKDIWSLTHAGGWKYGTLFFNIDMLESDGAEPAEGTTGGAQEAYVVFRSTLDIGKVLGNPTEFAFGPIRGIGLTGGFDWGANNQAGYESKKQMLVLGPTLMMNVPGFFNIDLLLDDESNDPDGIASRYTYALHPQIGGEWGIPITNFISFEGFAIKIAAKGLNEFGGPTVPELNIDTELMFDLSALFGAPNKFLRVGPEYQYWENKYGNPTNSADLGATASTPMIRVDCHF